MRQQFGEDIVRRGGHRGTLARRAGAVLFALALVLASNVHANDPKPASDAAAAVEASGCLPDGSGYLRARLSGQMEAELEWSNDETECTGAVRPTDGGIRMRFSRKHSPQTWVLVFGIAQLREGQSASQVPVNVTVIREGTGEFYSTQGDDKCMLDRVEQKPIFGIPRRARSYRVVARGFCTEPARAVNGTGAVLISRFDYAGRVDFGLEDEEPEPLVANQ